MKTICPWCNRRIGIHLNANLYRHGTGGKGTWCEGSGQHPSDHVQPHGWDCLVKIGTHSSNRVRLYANLWNGQLNPLPEPPEVGTLVAWQEIENGEVRTGQVTEIRDIGHHEALYMIERL